MIDPFSITLEEAAARLGTFPTLLADEMHLPPDDGPYASKTLFEISQLDVSASSPFDSRYTRDVMQRLKAIEDRRWLLFLAGGGLAIFTIRLLTK